MKSKSINDLVTETIQLNLPADAIHKYVQSRIAARVTQKRIKQIWTELKKTASGPEPFSVLNPRFVLTMGAVHEAYKDIPETVDLGIYDRATKKMVITINSRWANAICLERASDGPFSNLESWLNNLTPADLASEDLPL